MSDSGFILRLQVLKDSVLEATAALTFLINSPVGCREEEANLGAILTGWILACNPNR